MVNIAAIAQSLHQAAHQAKPTTQISLEHSITLDQAYEVQKELINLRLKEGETLIGLKMGFTSEAKMQQMGVHDLIWGRLTSAMLIPNNNTTSRSQYIEWNQKYVSASPKTSPENSTKLKSSNT
jgi:2-oxo-3-hexenedioate decarboxylase